MKISSHYKGKEQSFIKHRLLETYLERLFMIIGQHKNRIRYVDCFAGPWKAESDNLKDTSIAISLDIMKGCHESLKKYGRNVQFKALFIEKNRESYKTLNSFLDKESTDEVCAESLPGDFYSLRSDILRWYFFRKLSLVYPKHILLDMLSFDHDRHGIEYLEGHLDEAEVSARILENLDDGIIIDDVLKNHIDYCRRHRVREVIKYALKEIVNPERERYDEIRRISLEAICKLSEDLSEIEDVLPDIKDKFKWQVVEELIKTKSERVYGFLEDVFQKSDGEDQINSSEYLIKFQDLTALRFYVDWIKGQKEFSRSLFDSSPLTALKISKAIPLLIELLELSYQENFEQPDMFARLDRLVLNSLTAIALESEKNYLDVKRSIEKFIVEYSPIYKNANWLYAFLDQLEHKYYVNKSEIFCIDDVIKKLGEIVW